MLILVGPSASGKTEAAKILIKKYGMEKLVTYTSREKRLHEVDDVDYHFITKEEFEKKIQENFFLEYVFYNNNFYGTAITGITSNKVVILEANGLNSYIQKAKDLIKICYLEAPIEVRNKRMIDRGDDNNAILWRLKKDDQIFNEQVKAQADWIIDAHTTTIEEMTDQIYNLYKGYII